jgi:hypothetical protein
MPATTPAAAIIEAPASSSILDEVIAIATKAVSSTVTDQAHRAAVCGCGGCKAQAIEAAEWAADMLDIA